MNLKEKQIEKNYIYEGKIIKVRKDTALLPNEQYAIREVVEHNGGVCVAPLTDNNELIFVKQFRYPYMEELLELPAGKRDSINEDPEKCGIRELKEETGAVTDRLISLGELYPSPGYCGEIIWMYLAQNLTYGDCNPDEDEFLEVYKIPLNNAVEMVLNGEIKDAKTQAAVLKVKYLKDNGKI